MATVGVVGVATVGVVAVVEVLEDVVGGGRGGLLHLPEPGGPVVVSASRGTTATPLTNGTDADCCVICV